jgi:transcriptional regulator with XRE-family HTH domain
MTEESIQNQIFDLLKQIEEARKEQNLTQGQLSKKAGIYQTVYSDIKMGVRPLSLKRAIVLSDALGLKIQITQ